MYQNNNKFFCYTDLMISYFTFDLDLKVYYFGAGEMAQWDKGTYSQA